ncbi:MAG: hypothetical protein ACI9RP_002415, partial [Cyclobacteriaceae bacterium]
MLKKILFLIAFLLLAGAGYFAFLQYKEARSLSNWK